MSSAASWPRIHHDAANSGDARRDAVAPGRPRSPTLVAGTLRFTAPGDDLRCGTADRYEVRTSDRPITAATFADATVVPVDAEPRAAGEQEALRLPAGTLRRHVAVRAVDEQRNPGPVAALAR